MPHKLSPNTLFESLSLAGLSENDALVYGALLGHTAPSASVRDIMKATRLSRTMVYYVVGRLLENEAIRAIQTGGKTRYVVEPPENLVTLLEKKERAAQRQRELFQASLSGLRSLYNLSRNKPGVRFLEGFDGIREALFETLSSQEMIRAFVDLESIAPVDAINKEYVKKRRKLGIDKQILLIDTPASRTYIGNQGSLLTQARFLPPSVTPFHMSMELAGGSVIYLSLRNKNPLAIVMSDPDIYDMHRQLFDLLWATNAPKNIAHTKFA